MFGNAVSNAPFQRTVKNFTFLIFKYNLSNNLIFKKKKKKNWKICCTKGIALQFPFWGKKWCSFAKIIIHFSKIITHQMEHNNCVPATKNEDVYCGLVFY